MIDAQFWVSPVDEERIYKSVRDSSVFNCINTHLQRSFEREVQQVCYNYVARTSDRPVLMLDQTHGMSCINKHRLRSDAQCIRFSLELSDHESASCIVNE